VRGLWLEGSDANAGVFEGFDITACATGIYDDSFLGSVHVGHAIESGVTAIESVRQANYSTWVGTYVEGGPQIVAVGNLTTVGGNTIPRMPGSRVGYGFSRLTFREQVNGRDIRVTIPHAAGDSAMLAQFGGTYGDPLAWALYHHPLTGTLGWMYNGVQPVGILRDAPPHRARYRLGTEAP